MEKIYFEIPQKKNPVMACKETVRFLTDFSKSFCIVNQNKIQFELSLN